MIITVQNRDRRTCDEAIDMKNVLSKIHALISKM